MRQSIKEFLNKHRASGDTSISDDEFLLETGVMDSMLMVSLIAFLEEHFEIHVDDDDLDPDNFESVDAIVDYVERKRKS